jgi:hypothetical protein
MAQRGSPGLQGAGDRMAPGKPARVNRRRVRALSPLAPCTRSRLRAEGRAKARWTYRFASTISMRSGCCRFCWFTKQPRRAVTRGQRRSTCARADASWRAKRWSVRANAGRNSHCAPIRAAIPLRPHNPRHRYGSVDAFGNGTGVIPTGSFVRLSMRATEATTFPPGAGVTRSVPDFTRTCGSGA